MPANMNQQQSLPQQASQARYLVSQPAPSGQQSTSNRQPSSTNIQTLPISTSTSSLSTSSTGPKKGPAVPPGIFPSSLPPTQPPYSTAYSTNYGIPSAIGGQHQTGGASYSTPYDAEHLFTNAFMQLASTQQPQSPSGAYGSVTPPVQQQQQQQANNNDNKTMGYAVGEST